MAIREGRWDCQYCGTKGLLGRDKVCPNCARSRPEGTKFYLPDDEGVVEEQSLLEKAQKGPDWICEYCASSNPADLDTCRHCNAPREGTSPQQQVKKLDLDEVARSGDMTVPDPHEKYRQEPPPQPKEERPKWLVPVAVAIGVLLLLCAGLLLFRGGDVEVSVAGVSWERTVAVEAMQTVTEEDWDVPEGGRILGEREEIREYESELVGYETRQRQVSEQVQVGERTYVCGQEDLGNGFFEDIECTEPIYETQTRIETYEEPIYRQVPVYDTMFTYEIDRWAEVRTERATGRDHNTFWPELTLGPNEREGARNEQYHIVFVDGDGKEYELTMPETEWLSYEPNGQYTVKLNGLGRVVEVGR